MTKIDELISKLEEILIPFIEFAHERCDKTKALNTDNNSHVVYGYNHKELTIGDFKNILQFESAISQLKEQIKKEENINDFTFPYLKSEYNQQLERITKIIGKKPDVFEQGINALLYIIENKVNPDVMPDTCCGKYEEEQSLKSIRDKLNPQSTQIGKEPQYITNARESFKCKKEDVIGFDVIDRHNKKSFDETLENIKQTMNGKKIKFKFGDIIINHHASEDNPQRQGIFVNYDKNTIVLTDMKGKFWFPLLDNDAILEIKGSVLKKEQSLKDENAILTEILSKKSRKNYDAIILDNPKESPAEQPLKSAEEIPISEIEKEIITRHEALFSEGDYATGFIAGVRFREKITSQSIQDINPPYPDPISKHQTDINIGWIRAMKYMKDQSVKDITDEEIEMLVEKEHFNNSYNWKCAFIFGAKWMRDKIKS
jgi:hypothetical protein